MTTKLTDDEAANLAAWTCAHRPELVDYAVRTRAHFTTRPTRVEVVATEQERPMTRVPSFDPWTYEIAGQSDVIVGMPVNIARKAQRRRERIETIIGVIGIVAGSAVVLLAMGWVVALSVKYFWAG